MDPEAEPPNNVSQIPVARLAPKQWHRYDHGGPPAQVHPAITPCNVPTLDGVSWGPRNTPTTTTKNGDFFKLEVKSLDDFCFLISCICCLIVV